MAKRKMKETDSRKVDFEFNQAAIRDAYIDILKSKQGRNPTLAEIAERVGLSVTTVKKHLDELDRKKLGSVGRKKFKVLTDDMILSIYRAGMKGNAASQKLWMQIVEDWNEKQETKHSGEIKTVNQPPVIVKITKSK